MITILDGPLGTELNARGVPTDDFMWSASALKTHPHVVQQIHHEYATAGATLHTANTFRTRRRNVGNDWIHLTQQAVTLARESIPQSHRVAGSIAPLEDCYRPDLSPREPRDEHREFAAVLADTGCDLMLCETFPHGGEALVAVEEAVRTGTETWLALTAGPQANLLTPEQVKQIAKRAVDVGATAILVNCVPAIDTVRFVAAVADANLNVSVGAYANAGDASDRIGWETLDEVATERYANFAKEWVDAGASILGGCCGTSPKHIAAIHAMLA